MWYVYIISHKIRRKHRKASRIVTQNFQSDLNISRRSRNFLFFHLFYVSSFFFFFLFFLSFITIPRVIPLRYTYQFEVEFMEYERDRRNCVKSTSLKIYVLWWRRHFWRFKFFPSSPLFIFYFLPLLLDSQRKGRDNLGEGYSFKKTIPLSSDPFFTGSILYDRFYLVRSNRANAYQRIFEVRANLRTGIRYIYILKYVF